MPMDTTSLPVIVAPSMLIAQGVRLSADQDAAVTAAADRFRAKCAAYGIADLATAPTTISVDVRSAAGDLLGRLTYTR